MFYVIFDYSIENSSIFPSNLVPKRPQNETRKNQKITKIPMFVARWSFWAPLADFGLSIFARLGTLYGFIMVAGDAIFAPFYYIVCIFGLPWS